MAEKGILHMRMGPGKHLHGVNLLDGAVRGDEFDYFHDLIMAQEGVRDRRKGWCGREKESAGREGEGASGRAGSAQQS